LKHELGEKLNSMEDYCKRKHIFFNENERITHSIKNSRGLFNEFKSSINKGCKNPKKASEKLEQFILDHVDNTDI